MTKVLKISYSPYVLHAKKGPNSKSKGLERQGFLLKILFKDIGFGYADCHPLLEFGDLSTHEQISLLKRKKFTPITQRSLYFAQLDAKFRKECQSAFVNITNFPKNNFTSPALISRENILLQKNAGFTKFKYKFGNHIPNELTYLSDNFDFFTEHKIKLRLDYNGNLKQINILDTLKNYSSIIEYIEDPFPIIDQYYRDILKKYFEFFNFAMDFIVPDKSLKEVENYFTYKIVKPARENFHTLNFKPQKKLIFTSSMDHPLGQICALFEACHHTDEYCGLLTHGSFEPNAYSEQLIVNNTSLMPPEGLGFGFDSLLDREKWRKCF